MNPFIESTVAKALCKNTNKKVFWRNYHKHKAIRIISTAAVMAGVMLPSVTNALDLNQASIQELLELKGIGPKTAQMIIDERDRGGNYESIEDLSDRVKGIGPKKAESLSKAGLVVKSESQKD